MFAYWAVPPCQDRRLSIGEILLSPSGSENPTDSSHFDTIGPSTIAIVQGATRSPIFRFRVNDGREKIGKSEAGRSYANSKKWV